MHQMSDPAQGQNNTRFGLTVMMAAIFMMFYQTMFMPPADPSVDNENQVASTEAVAKNNNTQGTVANSTNANVANGNIEEQQATEDNTPESTKSIQIPVSETRDDAAVRGGYIATISNKGAYIKDFVLDGYDAPEGSRVDADGKITLGLSDQGGAEVGLMSLSTRGESDFTLRPNATYQLVKNDVAPDGEQTIIYEHVTNEQVVIRRAYTFHPGEFTLAHDITIENRGVRSTNVALDIGLAGAGIESGGGMFAASSAQFQSVCKNEEERAHYTRNDLEEEHGQLDGHIKYSAISWHYFIAALVPNAGDVESCYVPGSLGEQKEDDPGVLHNRLQYKKFALSPGANKTLSSKAFLGPKQLELLEAVDVGLEENLEFGFFEFISKPILWVLVWLYGLLGNFGWAIIVLTVLIKVVTFPLTQKSYVSMQQMKVVGPALKELQKKYAHDRAMLGQKQMELYKEKGINPLAGCLPMLLQMPIWFALFRTLWNSVELYQQPFVSWITDLSQPDMLPLLGLPLLPFIVGALMFAQTAFQPTPQDQPQMKYIMMGMPVFMVVLYFSMPSGLAIYSITNSALTMIQQAYIKRQYGDGQSAAT